MLKKGRLLCMVVIFTSGMAPPLAWSQDSAKPLQFDVASVRPSTEKSIRGSEGGPGSKDPTLYRFGQATLLDLMMVAWNVQPFQISSSGSLDHERFDLTARLPDDATKDQFRTMLQNFLAERFGLKVHVETREFPGYALVVAKSGLKIREANPDDPPTPAPKAVSGPDWPTLPPHRPTTTATVFFLDGYAVSRLRVQLEPLSIVSRFLPREDNLPVVDETGLAGKYSFALEYTTSVPANPQDALPPAPDLFSALRNQLGLELVRQKLPFEVVVVDSVTPTPTEN